MKAATTRYAATLALVLGVGYIAIADDFNLDWWTVDGGGETRMTGGDFELSGTVGQPDAGSVAMTGSDFALTGGFWFGIPPGDCDGDGNVDLDDFADFQACLLGPGGGLGTNCNCLDFDGNGDVDLADFGDFQAAFDGG